LEEGVEFGDAEHHNLTWRSEVNLREQNMTLGEKKLYTSSSKEAARTASSPIVHPICSQKTKNQVVMVNLD
jgi:hypothetical protein